MSTMSEKPMFDAIARWLTGVAQPNVGSGSESGSVADPLAGKTFGKIRTTPKNQKVPTDVAAAIKGAIVTAPPAPNIDWNARGKTSNFQNVVNPQDLASAKSGALNAVGRALEGVPGYDYNTAMPNRPQFDRSAYDRAIERRTARGASIPSSVGGIR